MLPRSGAFRSGNDLDFVAVKSRSRGRRLAPTKPGGLAWKMIGPKGCHWGKGLKPMISTYIYHSSGGP